MTSQPAAHAKKTPAEARHPGARSAAVNVAVHVALIVEVRVAVPVALDVAIHAALIVGVSVAVPVAPNVAARG
jgi:hypothetical protein